MAGSSARRSKPAPDLMNEFQMVSEAGDALMPPQVSELVTKACPVDAYRGQRILLIVPDGTRTAPVGLLFRTIHAAIGEVTSRLDVMIALGTHPPMSEEAICQRLEISLDQRR